MKKSKQIILLIVFLFFSASAVFCQSENLDESILGVVNAFADKDTSKINNYINEGNGLWFMIPFADRGECFKRKEYDFNNPEVKSVSFPEITTTNNQINYKKLPTYNSIKKKWDIRGLFCDTVNQYQYLSDIAVRIREGGGYHKTLEDIEQMKLLEKNSYRVIYVADNGNSIVFYMTKIDKKWYLSIFDRWSIKE